ncbi:hypothetical protein J6497_01100 [Bradyrhizobium sp. CNPSo 4026]|nr:hypothetical protein [Bradyrhizobium cenepequi]
MGPSTAKAGLALSMLTLSPEFAFPQAAPPVSLGVQSQPQQPPQPNQAPPPVREENPGLINEIGKLFEKSKSILPPLKSPGETMDDLNTSARDVGDSLSALTKPSLIVTGRVACLVAANGAPDCKVGADKLCQSKGYKEGKSLDTDAAEKCSPIVFVPGHKRGPNDCRTENFVTRAICQ